MVQRKSLTNKCLRKCINCLGKIAELLIWNTATTRKIENEKHLIVNLGHCLNIALFVQVQSFTCLQPSYPFQRVSDGMDQNSLLPTHLWSSECHNSRTILFNRWVLPSISKALLGYFRLVWHSGLYFCFSLKTPFNEWASASCFWEFWINFKEQPWYTFSVNAVLSIKAWNSSACMPMALPG